MVRSPSLAASASRLVLGLSLVLSMACSGRRASPAPASAAAPEAAPVTLARARDLVQAANLEIANLRDMQPRVQDEATREAIGRQIATIADRRAALEADIEHSRPGAQADPKLRADASNLERAVSAGANASFQRVEPPGSVPQGSPEGVAVPSR